MRRCKRSPHVYNRIENLNEEISSSFHVANRPLFFSKKREQRKIKFNIHEVQNIVDQTFHFKMCMWICVTIHIILKLLIIQTKRLKRIKCSKVMKTQRFVFFSYSKILGKYRDWYRYLLHTCTRCTHQQINR